MGWSPQTYQRFQRERQRPADDLQAALVRSLDGHQPRTVVDLGCGTGDLAVKLAGIWPDATVTGIDSAPAMLAKAKASAAGVSWLEADITTWQAEPPVEVIVSNAALHWIADHQALFDRLIRSLVDGGLLAVQMPRNFAAPSHTLLAETMRDGPWAELLEAGPPRPPPVLPPTRYIDWLAPKVQELEVWETEYYHRLVGDDPVLAWTRGTALVPILDRLTEDQAEAFQAAYRRRLRAAYPPRNDGTTLLPFRRLFILAKK